MRASSFIGLRDTKTLYSLAKVGWIRAHLRKWKYPLGDAREEESELSIFITKMKSVGENCHILVTSNVPRNICWLLAKA